VCVIAFFLFVAHQLLEGHREQMGDLLARCFPRAKNSKERRYN